MIDNSIYSLKEFKKNLKQIIKRNYNINKILKNDLDIFISYEEKELDLRLLAKLIIEGLLIKNVDINMMVKKSFLHKSSYFCIYYNDDSKNDLIDNIVHLLDELNIKDNEDINSFLEEYIHSNIFINVNMFSELLNIIYNYKYLLVPSSNIKSNINTMHRIIREMI